MRFNAVRRHWKKRIVRLGAAMLLFTAALVVQYYLTNIPVVKDVGAYKEFNPAILELGQKELVVDGAVAGRSVHRPAGAAPETLLLSHDGRSDEVMDVHFDKARLADETIRMLTGLGLDPPAGPERIDYVTSEVDGKPGEGKPCMASLKVKLGDSDAPPARLHLFQLGSPGFDLYRHVEMKAGGGELVIEMDTAVPRVSDPMARGCKKLLGVGDWQQEIYAPSTVRVVAEADSTFRFQFRPIVPTSPSWSTTDGLLELVLGPPLTPDNPAPFQAREVQVISRNTPDSKPPILGALSPDGEPTLLALHGLKLGSDHIQINVAGRGWVRINGRLETADILGRVQKYPILAGLFGTANAALVGWLVLVVLGKRRPSRPRRRSSPLRPRGKQQRQSKAADPTLTSRSRKGKN